MKALKYRRNHFQQTKPKKKIKLILKKNLIKTIIFKEIISYQFLLIKYILIRLMYIQTIIMKFHLALVQKSKNKETLKTIKMTNLSPTKTFFKA